MISQHIGAKRTPLPPSSLTTAAAALPILGMLWIALRQLMTKLWRKSRGKAPQNVVVLTAVAALLTGLTWSWWPDGGPYRPVQPYERGTLADTTTSVVPQSGAALRDGNARSTVAFWPAGADLPRRDDSQLSTVLVPAASPGEPATRIAPASWESPAPPWVFPFDRPDAPEDDGNQALAVNTTDGSVTYSVEFDLVWAEDGEPVETRNEAYAFANCTGCAAVAVGFQVVLIEEQSDVIAPENHSAAVNYNCLECHTYALASQLVLTVDCALNDDGMEQLSELWTEIDEYGSNLENVPLSEIQSRLEAYKEQIIAIVQADTSDTTDGAATSTEPSPPALGDPPPSSVPTVEAPAPTADTGGTAPAAELQPSATSV